MSRQNARKQLERRLRGGSTWHGPLPDTLKRSEIITLEEVFQFRKPLAHKSEAHKTKLGRTVRRTGRGLGRLLVYWVGDAWVCIDGHHRLAAYQATGLEDVPVDAFCGEPHAAVKEALKRNTEDKLSMDDRERTAAAWAIVTTWNDEFTRQEIAEQAGVSTSTVANMRRVFEQLKKKRPLVDLSDLAWWQARELAKGGSENGLGNLDEKRQEHIIKIRDGLIKQFGASLSNHPDRLAAALKAYDEDLPAALQGAFKEQAEEELLAGATEDNEPGGLPFPNQKAGQEESV